MTPQNLKSQAVSPHANTGSDLGTGVDLGTGIDLGTGSDPHICSVLGTHFSLLTGLRASLDHHADVRLDSVLRLDADTGVERQRSSACEGLFVHNLRCVSADAGVDVEGRDVGERDGVWEELFIV